ncbi:MAG: serine/threonine protein kinase [Deltaproteobacteria bacterium]|nr:MAG: serine/threonine protein kinase [Deltaproteobacteria bacterium]
MDWICSHCGEKFSRSRTRCPSDGHRVVEDLSGTTIGGRYQVRELIGVGGMDSSVWKAWQTGTERTVAVKVLPPADDAASKRFARGARIAANLTHPNCLVIHDYGSTEDGKLYLVMEFLPGQVLTDVLGDDPMPVKDAIHVADQILQALEHAHNRRAVHRDLKPDNLFVTRKNDDPLHIKILDYGIAKYIEEDPTEPSPEQQGDDFDLVTEQRQVCGTPQYMAPEQVVGGRVDARTDVYSLGVVMYRMLTGRLPFDGKTRYELYQKHLQERPPTFRDAARPDVGPLPRDLEMLVQRALAKNPGQRFQSAAEMRRALASVDLTVAPPLPARPDTAPRVSKSATAHGLQPVPKQPKGVTVVLEGALEDVPEESAEDFAPPTLVFPDAPIQPRRGTVSLQAPVPSPSQTEPNSSEQGAVAPPAPRRPPRR